MIRALVGLLLVLAPVSALAGTGAKPTPLGLTAAPAHVVLAGSGTAAVRIRNPGTNRVAVDAVVAGFALDLRGRPRIVGRHRPRSAAEWLRVRPTRFTLAPHRSARVFVEAKVPRRAAPGDHDALVVLSARPLANARVSVRLRLGVVVVVRAPGAAVRCLQLGQLRTVRRGAGEALELVVVNAGNVTERLLRVRAVMARLRTRHHVATVASAARELRPRTRGVLEFRLRSRVHGPVTARIVIPGEPGRPALRRTYRLRI